MCSHLILGFLTVLGIMSPVGWILISLAMCRRER